MAQMGEAKLFIKALICVRSVLVVSLDLTFQRLADLPAQTDLPAGELRKHGEVVQTPRL